MLLFGPLLAQLISSTEVVPLTGPPQLADRPIVALAEYELVTPTPVNPEPSPTNAVAVTIPKTSSLIFGVVVPMPPFGFFAPETH